MEEDGANFRNLRMASWSGRSTGSMASSGGSGGQLMDPPPRVATLTGARWAGSMDSLTMSGEIPSTERKRVANPNEVVWPSVKASMVMGIGSHVHSGQATSSLWTR
eukprot:CAMPEP_0169466254 /NCGR_PEP_ID=MMETSP1042-20121227/21669_1 /TAXON_ID=464988 /ORGANISM="Hemiselmis andersenii, Strain CCMP1180" /LENGTH=105 /DNA_ID=CAMNT_0009579293 /DNA_START=15 /DNA_END=329 /DNA_ORIENTATION=+